MKCVWLKKNTHRSDFWRDSAYTVVLFIYLFIFLKIHLAAVHHLPLLENAPAAGQIKMLHQFIILPYCLARAALHQNITVLIADTYINISSYKWPIWSRSESAPLRLDPKANMEKNRGSVVNASAERDTVKM